MATERLDMIRVREILRQKLVEERTHREIARSLSVSAGTVGATCSRAARLAIAWEQVVEMSDEALDAKVFGARGKASSTRPMPDWSYVHAEVRKKGVTLMLLHLEYLEAHADGLRFSSFCDHYAAWKKRQQPTMRQTHTAGENMFVDYAGQKPRIVDAKTGEVREVELFVAVLGASNLVFAEATESQRVPDFVGSCRRAFESFGGVTAAIVPDQLKSAVVKSDRYEPEIQRTFHEFGEHYGSVVMPARPRHPRDKAKVEVGVQVVERWILARMRKETFYSLGAANMRIAELLAELNEKFVMRAYKATRRELFERVEKGSLRPLPAEPFEAGEWRHVRVHFDYHVELDGHFYSAPYTLLRQHVWTRSTPTTVEIFHDHGRVGAHARSYARGRHTTLDAHMPEAHRQHAAWTPERLVSWAETNVGPTAAELCAVILEKRRHPQQGYRSCLGIIRLSKGHERARVEAACAKALAMNVYSSRFVSNVLARGLDRGGTDDGGTSAAAVVPHENLRGPDYYH